MKDCRKISDGDIAKIAEMHNQVLSDAFKRLDYAAEPHEEELRRVFYSSKVIPDFSRDDIQYTIDYNIDFNKSLVKLKNSTLIKPYVDDISSLVNSATSYDSLSSSLSRVEADANRNLTCEYLDIILILITVTRKSAYFWFPIIGGGSGEGQTILKTAGYPASKQNPIVRADGQGAAGGFMEFAILGAFGGPAGAGALLGSVIIGAAWSSAMAAYGQP